MISPFGWKEDGPPDIDAANLEKDRAEIAAFAESVSQAPKVEELHEIEGTHTLSVSTYNVFTGTIKGATTLEKPTGWPEGYYEALVLLRQSESGGNKVTLGSGITLVGGAFNEEPNALNVFNFVSENGGNTVFAINAVEGKMGLTGATGSIGSTGATGATGREGPPGAIGNTEALGEVEGTIKLNLETALAWTMTAKGNLKIEFEHWPEGEAEPILYVFQNSAGNHKIEIPGVTWQNEAPEFNEGANALNIIPLSSPNKGVNVYGIRGQIGKTGATGSTGATGPEGKVGPWEEVTLGPKLNYLEGEKNKCEARSEQGGATVRVRGMVEVKSGEKLKTTDTIMTLPSALRPSKEVNPFGASSSPGILLLKVAKTTGIMQHENTGTEYAAGIFLRLELTFPLT